VTVCKSSVLPGVRRSTARRSTLTRRFGVATEVLRGSRAHRGCWRADSQAWSDAPGFAQEPRRCVPGQKSRSRKYLLPSGGTVNVELRSRAILGSRRVRGQRNCADDASIPNVYRHSGTHHEKILGELIDPGTANLLKSPVCIQQDPYARLKVNCIRLVQLTIKRQDLSSTFGSEASQKDAVA
jgi:hypothetical protein